MSNRPDLGRGIVQGIFEQLVGPDARTGSLKRVPVGILVERDVERMRDVLSNLTQGGMPGRCCKDPLANLQHTSEGHRS